MSLSKSHPQHQRADSGFSEYLDDMPSAKATKQCLFLEKLPGDIRNIIYEKLFYHPDGIHIDFNSDQPKCNIRNLSALAMTCKQIHYECSSLPYWLNTFHFHVPILQDTHNITCPPVMPPLPARDPSFRRPLRLRSGNVTSKSPKLKEKAQAFVTMVMRVPHVDSIIDRFSQVVNYDTFMSQLRGCCIHLGSQTENAFVARFLAAWDQVVPSLRILREHAEVRVSFELRISKRLVVAYDVGLKDLETTLRDLDRCVVLDGEFTLPELSSINAVGRE